MRAKCFLQRRARASESWADRCHSAAMADHDVLLTRLLNIVQYL